MLEFGLELVLILPLRAQESPIEDVSSCAIVRDSHVDFSEINARHALFHQWQGWLDHCLHAVGGNGLILLACPADDDRSRELPRPIEHQWGVAFAIGEDELSILVPDSYRLVLNSEVPAPAARRVRIGVGCPACPPTLEGGEESLDTGIGGMGVQLLGGMPAHHLRR